MRKFLISIIKSVLNEDKIFISVQVKINNIWTPLTHIRLNSLPHEKSMIAIKSGNVFEYYQIIEATTLIFNGGIEGLLKVEHRGQTEPII